MHLFPMKPSADNSSWLSWAKNWVANTWLVKQGQAVNKKLTKAQRVEQKWSGRYQEQETMPEAPITQAVQSADKFKRVLLNAAANDSTGIMSPFISHPEQFLFGASSSSYQYEGGLDVVDANGMYRNANAQFYHEKELPLAGQAIDFWDRYHDDIKQMKEELGINSFRLSIAWDRVEPEQGKYDGGAILRYVNMIMTLKEHNIEPIVVLHHYTVPTWFLNLGGFEKAGNINHFVQFAQQMYDALYEQVTYWSTFNAIEGYAFKGYSKSALDGPPGDPNNSGMYITQQVMANMLEAHVRFYQSVKNKEDGLYYEKLKENNAIPNPQIGIQKNIVVLDPIYQNTYFLTRFASATVSVIGEGAQNKGFFDFFTTGTFRVVTPKIVYLYNEKAPESLDWIGLNVYSNMIMRFKEKQIESNKDKATTNINYRDYPEGIYRATKEIYNRLAKPLQLPIIITENGIATNDNTKRTRFFQRTLFTIRTLIEKGYPIIGYTPWASHDNYEWPSKEQPDSLNRRYGFFHVNFDENSKLYLKRTLKNGAHYYRDFIKQFFLKNNNTNKTIPPLTK